MTLLQPKAIIFMAIVSGAVATYGIHNYIENQAFKEEKPAVLVAPVVVAARDIPSGISLEPALLKLKEWPVDIIPPGSFVDSNQVVNRVTKTEIYANEAILENKLAPKGSVGGVTSLIPPGMRAITVAVNIVSGVAGFILPNTRVDVLTTVSNSNQAKTKIILQNVLVLAVDQTYRKNDDDPVTVKSVTVLVTPEEAEKLTLATTEGKLHLVLRNSSDTGREETYGVDIRRLFSNRRYTGSYTPQVNSNPKEDENKKSSSRVVEIIRSNERSEIEFKEENNDEEKKNAQKYSN
jgi:pilus assembly protein CpaB